MSERLIDAAAESNDEPSLVDDTARRIMTARFIADEILRGSKRVSLKAARALADGFVARDRQAAAAISERREADLSAEDLYMLRLLREDLSRGFGVVRQQEGALIALDKLTQGAADGD